MIETATQQFLDSIFFEMTIVSYLIQNLCIKWSCQNGERYLRRIKSLSSCVIWSIMFKKEAENQEYNIHLYDVQHM